MMSAQLAYASPSMEGQTNTQTFPEDQEDTPSDEKA